MDETKRDTHDWLYPEMLSQECLVNALKQRYIKNKSLENLPKEELVDLYYCYVIPLPQRKYRMNRRGREMTKKQITLAKKRKYFDKDETEPLAKKSQMEPNARLLTSFDDPAATQKGNRLKPPPSCVDFSKKKIQLGNKTNNTKSGGDKTDPKCDPTEKESSTKTGKKKITLISFSSSSSSEGSSSSSSSYNSKPPTKEGNVDMKKTVSMINKHLSLNSKEGRTRSGEGEKMDVENSSEKTREEDMEVTATQEEPSKKKKFKKISWP